MNSFMQPRPQELSRDVHYVLTCIYAEVNRCKRSRGMNERIHSDTYIPVQPNLQPKPQAERKSGRKKESTTLSVTVNQEKKSCIEQMGV